MGREVRLKMSKKEMIITIKPFDRYKLKKILKRLENGKSVKLPIVYYSTIEEGLIK